MEVKLKITEVNSYFEQEGIEIDYEEEYDIDKVSVKEANHIQSILTCEVSIYLLRRSIGFCGSLVDNMIDIRRDFINSYEKEYCKKYINNNDFF